MVALTSLVVPILVASVLVFIASMVIHMFLGYHASDFRMLAKPAQNDVLEGIRRLNLSPGEYIVPHPGKRGDMKDPEFLANMKKGPLVLMTLAPGAEPAMAGSLIQWFVFVVVINLFAGYVASRALGPGADYLMVFRFVGTTAFMGYSMGAVPESIWYRRGWGRTLKTMADGLFYALLAAGAFGWLWPR